MKQKYDFEKNVKLVLKKFNLDDIIDEVSGWADMEADSPAALKKHFISSFNVDNLESGNPIDYYDVVLSDPTTWGDENEYSIPSDEFFVELYKAIRADEKRNAKHPSLTM